MFDSFYIRFKQEHLNPANLDTRAIPFQALSELMNKREKDLSRKDNIFEIAEEDELLNDINDSKNKFSLPDEDLL